MKTSIGWPAWVPRLTSLALQRHNWVWGLVAMVLLGGMGLVGHRLWLLKRSQSPVGSSLSLLGGTAHAKAQNTARLATPQDLQRDCLSLVQQRLYRQAIVACDRFTVQSDLAPRAHATLAALYTARANMDLPNSVRHALRAAELGDARGKFLLAAHMLAGFYQPFDQQRLRQLLTESQAGGVKAASTYLQILRESQECRVTTQLQPLGLPVFCMFRAELQQALRQKGLRLKDEDLLVWQDRFSPGDVLANARDAEVVFDVNPREEIHRVARLSYQITDELAQGRWADLQDSLTRKYGQPQTRVEGRELSWRMRDGSEVHLVKEDEWQMRLSYEQPQRLRDRAAHLALVERLARQDRVVAEAQSL